MRLNGIRGTYLLAWGIGYFGLGLSYIIAPTPGRQAAFSWLPVWDEPDKWGWIWLVASVTAIVTAFRHTGSSVNTTDRWGFAALFIPPVIWTMIFGVACFLIHDVSPLATVLIYGPLAVGQYAASRMENNHHRDRIEGSQSE